MDPTAVNYNVTIDDFDSILTYSDQALWTTTDPSSFNFTSDGSPWLRGTYHNTTVKGASVTLNFTGPAIYVYGATGPAYGAYEVVLDSKVTLNGTAFRTASSTGSHLLFGSSDLTYGNHSMVLRNLGASTANSGNAFLLDYIQSTIQLAPAGATVKNVTYEETDPAIGYGGRGIWYNNTSPFFSGGRSTYTNGYGAFFQMTFQGSAVYVFGDKKNDHRGYAVSFGGKMYEYNGTSGCGGAFGETCEEQRPCIKFMASNLAKGNHTITVLNRPEAPGQKNFSYFDFDSVVVTVPSTYAPRELSNGTYPFVAVLNSTVITDPTAGGTGSGSTAHSAAPNALPMMSNSLLLLVITVILLLRPWAGSSNSRK